MIKAKYVSSTALSVLMGISMIAGLGSVTPGGTMASPLADKGGLNRATDGSAAGESGGKDGNGASSDASHKAGGQAFTLMSLKHETVGPLTRIVVESSAPPLYTVSRPNDRLIVIELPGGDGSKLAREYAIGTSTVDSIRVKGVGSPTASVASSAGAVQTRIEIGVKTGIKDRSSLTGNTLVLELSPEQAASAAGHLSSESAGPDSRHDNDGVSPSANRRVSDAVDVGVPNQGTAKAGVYVYPVSVRSSSKSDARPAEQAILKPATVIRRLRTEPGEAGLRIVLDADGQPEFKDFTLTDPARIVVDVIGVRSELENKAMAVDQGGIQRIRVGQPSSGVVRIVLDSKQKVAYRVLRNGDSLIIDIGNEAFKPAAVQEPADSSVKIDQSVKQDKAAQLQSSSAMLAVEPKRSSDAEKSAERSNASSGAVKPAGGSDASAQKSGRAQAQPVQNQPAQGMAVQVRSGQSQQVQTKSVAAQEVQQPSVKTQLASSSAGPASGAPASSQTPVASKNLIARADTGARSRPGEISSLSNPASKAADKDGSHDKQLAPRRRVEPAMCDLDYVGGPISFDLRAVDIREMLRFIYQNYGVNFIVDKSVAQVPVDITITGVPWNQVMNAVLRANRLGWVCEDQGRIVRIATLSAIKEEESERQAIAEEKTKGIPVKTVIRHLKYARAAGSLSAKGGGGGAGASGGGGGSVGGGGGGGGAAGGRGTLLSIVTTRNSPRGKTEVDSRTNSLIITDIPERIDAIMAIIDLLDKPEAQVEIEARIIVADRNFLRDLGVQLGAAVANGKTGGAVVLETGPINFSPGNLGSSQSGGGSSGGSGSGSGGGTSQNQIASNIPFAPAQSALQATANTVLGLTSGRIGTGILSAALSASETKGQIRTISTPRITAQDNMTAEIVNGVQIPVQTVTNNTVTTTFVTAALRLEITPQIVEETGEVTMHIVAENNTVNTSLANQFNGGTPGINTQSAESIMRVRDGGTAVMGGINIDNETTTENRTPGLASVPILGTLFKRKTVSRDNSEILFFVTPRIVHREAPDLAPGPGSVQGSAAPEAPATDKATNTSPKQTPAVASAGSPSASK